MNDVLISALDLLTLFLVMLFLAVMAIKYDANKGLGDRNYVKVYNFEQKPVNASATRGMSRFQIVNLDQSSLRLSLYEEARETIIGTYGTVEALVASGNLKTSMICVIYEQQKSPMFADLVRGLVANKIPVSLAQVAK